MHEYLQQFKVIVDQLGAAGSTVSDDELFFSMLDGLPSSYGVVSAIIRYRAQTSSITREEAESLLLSEDLTLTRQADQQSEITALSSQRLSKSKSSSQNSGRGSRGSFYRRNGSGATQQQNSPRDARAPDVPAANGSPPPLSQQPIYCQICLRHGHRVIDCYDRMNYAYKGRHPPEKLAAMAASASMDDSTWYSDTGATHHITGDLGNLSLSAPYEGSDSVRVGNGQGLSISHTRSGLLPTPSHTFQLTNVLHCPQASSNL